MGAVVLTVITGAGTYVGSRRSGSPRGTTPLVHDDAPGAVRT